MELVITGYAGETGSRDIYQNKEQREKLLDRYPKSFFRVFEEPEEDCVTWGNVKGVQDVESAAGGGVYGAMWRILKRNGMGASYSQRLIPLRQQTVEICEMFGLDPYRLSSENCAVWLCTDAAPLKAHFSRAVSVGYTEKGPAIRRMDGETIAYLRKPDQ